MPIKRTHVDQQSLRAVIEKVGDAAVDLQLAWKAAIKAGGDRWLAIAREGLSRSDHTLDDLAKLDHPYARRHGSIQIHEGWALHMKDTRNLVHTHSGELLAALVGSFDEDGDNGPTYAVSLDPSYSPEVRWVLKGTKTMLPRDPLASAALAPQTQDDIRGVIVSRLQRRFGSTVQIKFS